MSVSILTTIYLKRSQFQWSSSFPKHIICIQRKVYIIATIHVCLLFPWRCVIDPFRGITWTECSEPCGDDGKRTRSADGAPGPQEIRCNTQSCEPSKYTHTHTHTHTHVSLSLARSLALSRALLAHSLSCSVALPSSFLPSHPLSPHLSPPLSPSLHFSLFT